MFDQVLDIQEVMVQERDLEKVSEEDEDWFLWLYHTKSMMLMPFNCSYRNKNEGFRV